ncbi:surfactant protein C-like [Rhinoderma darwinii]|uniref:surfactant protein C-like n=1 Tax=Rhinoderma darwinii TaxID=43563 RepID=UPI003F67C433
MEQKSSEHFTMELPPYSSFPRLEDQRKRWIMGIGLSVLLVVIIVGSTLTGLYMTQKHTETMVTMSFTSKDGENIQQTISINEQEGVAVFYVRDNKYPGTILYDYRRNLIGFRQVNGSTCYVLRMSESRVSPMCDLLRQIDYLQTQNAALSNEIVYSFTSGDAADPREMGIYVQILCSDVSIHWAKQLNPELRNWGVDVHFQIFGIPINVHLGK